METYRLVLSLERARAMKSSVAKMLSVLLFVTCFSVGCSAPINPLPTDGKIGDRIAKGEDAMTVTDAFLTDKLPNGNNPRSGNRVLVVNVSLENITSQIRAVYNELNFRLRTNRRGTIYVESSSQLGVGFNSFYAEGSDPTHAQVYFQVDPEELDGLVLEYQPLAEQFSIRIALNQIRK